MTRSRLVAVLATSIVAALPLHAQSVDAPRREASLSAGVASFDASGTGTAPTVALRAALPLRGRWLVAQASAAYASLGEQFSVEPTRLGVAEAQLQLQIPFARVRPYVGAGGGWLAYLSNGGGRRATGTVSVASGVRVGVTPAVSVQGELRVRGWGLPSTGSGFTNSMAEVTGGVAYHF